MKHTAKQLPRAAFPSLLLEIPQPPEHLWVRGELPSSELIYLSVVGSRKISSYGKQVIEHIVGGLAQYPICIVSGLALGVDAYAHEMALKHHLKTIAVPGSGLSDNALYPRSHLSLAKRIVDSGGCLLSEFEPEFKATPWSFPMRNRIMAGMSHGTLIIEAREKSGTLITARLTTDYNRELFVVPGNIFSENSKGVHQFLKLGATPVTDASDICEALHIPLKQVEPEDITNLDELSDDAQLVFKILQEPLSFETLILSLRLESTRVSVALTELELMGLISQR
ncbi:MAG: hypothetical protein RI911_769, partial [Candidatus Parcubacteria bacterium]